MAFGRVVKMKRGIWVLVLGFIFGISICFGAGSVELTEAHTILKRESNRLANDINFDNQSEVNNFENALKRSSALKNYMNVIKTLYNGAISENDLIEHENDLIQQEVKEQYIRQQEHRGLGIAEAWSTRNVMTGAVLFDLEMQQRIINDFEQNLARAQIQTEQYIGKIFQYTGQVYSVEKDKYNQGVIKVHLRRTDGVTVFANFNMDQTESVLQLDTGNVITVVGRCTRFLEHYFDSGLSSVSLENSVVKFVAK